jgi:hypothetical protein
MKPYRSLTSFAATAAFALSACNGNPLLGQWTVLRDTHGNFDPKCYSTDGMEFTETTLRAPASVSGPRPVTYSRDGNRYIVKLTDNGVTFAYEKKGWWWHRGVVQINPECHLVLVRRPAPNPLIGTWQIDSGTNPTECSGNLQFQFAPDTLTIFANGLAAPAIRVTYSYDGPNYIVISNSTTGPFPGVGTFQLDGDRLKSIGDDCLYSRIH